MRPARARQNTQPAASRSGAALIIAMICLLLAGAMSANIVRTALLQRQQMERHQWQWQADWLAESARQRALVMRQADPEYRGETWLPESDAPGSVIGRATISIERQAEDPSGTLLRVVVLVPDDPTDRVQITRTWPIRP